MAKALFSNVLSDIDKFGLKCELRNLSSVALRGINILVVNHSTIIENTNSDATSTIVDNTPAKPKGGIRDDYDYQEALIYIIFTLCFYSISVVLMILIQTKKSDFYYIDNGDDYDGNSARNMLKRIRNENIEREALGT